MSVPRVRLPYTAYLKRLFGVKPGAKVGTEEVRL
jgi:hypothetical protein